MHCLLWGSDVSAHDAAARLTFRSSNMKAKRTAPSHVPGHCTECEAVVTFAPVFVHSRVATDDTPEEYTLAACAVCGEPALFYREALDILQDILQVTNPSYSQLWPDNSREIKGVLPEEIDRPYSEACEAEVAKLPMASAVMIGRALEATCKLFDPTSTSIADGLRKMSRSGVLSDEYLGWANELRVIRNEAAHASGKHIDLEDVSEALDFLQAILDLLYHFRPRFKRFKERRMLEKHT